MSDRADSLDIEAIEEADRAPRLPYDIGVKDLAYQLWAFECGRRVRDVVRLLKNGEYHDGEPVLVDERTVRRWVHEGGWVQRVRDNIRQLAPDLNEQTVIDLVVGRRDAVRYLRRVVSEAEQPTPIQDQRRRVLTIDGEWVDVRAGFVPSKDAIAAAIALMDRGGLSHVGNGKDPTGSLTALGDLDQLPELDGKSVNELMAIEARFRSKP